MHANLKSVQLRHMSGQVVRQITKDMDDKIAKLPNNTEAIKSIVDSKISMIDTLGVSELTVNKNIKTGSIDVGGKTLVVNSEQASLDVGGNSLMINASTGSVFNTKLTSNAEMVTNDMFAFDRSNSIGVEHTVVMDKERIQFNDKVGIASGGLDVTGGNALFGSDVKVNGTLKATGAVDSTRHTTTTGETTTPTMTFSQGSIELHKPLMQSYSDTDIPLELRSKDVKSMVKVSDNAVKMGYPSGASEISVEYTGVTVSGGYGKNTTVFGNMFLNQSIYDGPNDVDELSSGKLTCTGVVVKAYDDNDMVLHSSIGVYQTEFRACYRDALFMYNGVKELNPISENTGSNTNLATAYTLHNKSADNNDVWETTQFISKRLLKIGDTFKISRYTDSRGASKMGMYTKHTSSDFVHGPRPLIADLDQYPFEEDDVYTVNGLKTVSVPVLDLNGVLSGSDTDRHVLTSYAAVSLSSLNGVGGEKWIHNPAKNCVKVTSTGDQLIMTDINTSEPFTGIFLGEEYDFDLSDVSLENYDQLHFTKYMNSNISSVTGVTHSCMRFATTDDGLNVGLSVVDSVMIDPNSREVTLMPITPGLDGSITSIFVNQYYITQSNRVYCYMVNKTNQVTLTTTDSYELVVNVAGNAESKVDMIENFMIAESHDKIDVRVSYLLDSNKWVINEDISNTDSVIVFKEFEIPSEVKFVGAQDGGTPGAQDLSITFSKRISKKSMFMVSVEFNINILCVSQYLGCWYKDIYHSLKDSGEHDTRPIPKKYKPFVNFGYYVEESSLVDGVYTVTKEWMPSFRKVTFQQENKTIFQDFDVENYWVDNVYLREKLANVNEETTFSKNFNWVHIPSNNDVVRLRFYPAIQFMGVGLKLQENSNDIFMSISECRR